MADKSLFITVGGTTTPLKQALNEGKGYLAEFAQAVSKTSDEAMAGMREALANPNTMKQMEAGLKAQISGMQRAAQEAIRAAQSTPGGMTEFGQMTTLGATAAATALEKLASAQRDALVAAEAATAANEQQLAMRATNIAALKAEITATEQNVGVYRDLAAVAPAASAEVLKVGGASGQARMGMMVMGEQFRQFGTEVALGISPMQAFTQQIGQVTYAMQIMGGEGNAFVRFLSRGWGIAIMTGVSVLGAMIGALAMSSKKTKEHADALETVQSAMRGEAVAADVLNDALAKLNDEQAKSLNLTNQEIKARREAAEATLAQATATRTKIAADLAEQHRYNPAQAGVQGFAGTSGSPAAAADSAMLAELDTRIAAARGIIDASIIQEARARSTHAGSTNFDFDQKKAALETQYRGTYDSTKHAYVGGLLNAKDITDARRTQLAHDLNKAEAELEITRGKAVAAAQKLDDAEKGKGVTIGSTVDKAMGADLFAAAAKFRGDGEGNGQLLGLFKQANVNVDPKITAWCAAFVNAVLATNGLAGTGSNAARSFLKYGSGTDKPELGDIVVARRGNNPAEGHVGFFQGTDAKGNILVLGGNTGNKVGTEAIAPKDVLGFRRVTGSSADMEAAARKAQEEADRQRHDSEAYTQAIDQSLAETARLRRDGVTDLTRLAQFDKGAIDAALKRKFDQNQKDAIDHEWTDAKLQELNLQDIINAHLHKEEIDRRLKQDLADRQFERDQDALDLQAALLDVQAQLATTTRERLAIALKLLEVDKSKQLLANDQALNDNRIDKDTHDARASNIIATADAKIPVAQKQNEGPLAQYREQLIANVGDMNEALQHVEADGLHSLEEGLLGIIDGTESVASAFKKMAASIIADLARIAIEKAILSFIGLKAGDVPGHATGHVPGFAAGVIHGPGTGTSDSILAWHDGMGLIRVSNGESIITAEGTRRHRGLLKAINDNALPAFADGMVASIGYPSLPTAASLRMGGAAPVHYFDLRGSVVLEELYRDMQRISAAHAQAAVAAGPGLAIQEMQEQRSMSIPG